MNRINLLKHNNTRLKNRLDRLIQKSDRLSWIRLGIILLGILFTVLALILSNEILEYIAYNITSNIRELEGCLIKLLANSSLNSKEINFDLVKQTVREVSTNKHVNISIDYITKIVCEYYSVDENKVREKNRRKEVVLARQVAMFLSKQLTKSSLKTIGLHFGGRDHSTVIHAQSTIEDMIKQDTHLADVISSLKNKIELSAA